MFWWYAQTHTEWVADDPARTHHFGCNSQNSEKPMLVLTYLDLKLVKNSFKFERIVFVCGYCGKR